MKNCLMPFTKVLFRLFAQNFICMFLNFKFIKQLGCIWKHISKFPIRRRQYIIWIYKSKSSKYISANESAVFISKIIINIRFKINQSICNTWVQFHFKGAASYSISLIHNRIHLLLNLNKTLEARKARRV